jgi:hypothetical protein
LFAFTVEYLSNSLLHLGFEDWGFEDWGFEDWGFEDWGFEKMP